MDKDLPRLYRRFRWFNMIWTVTSLGALAVAFVLVLVEIPRDGGWKSITVALLVLVQAGLYLRFIVYGGWPFPLRWIGAYFTFSLAIWLVEVWLAPQVWWLGFPYLGQMYGMLPLFPAFLGSLVVIAAMVWANLRLEFLTLSPLDLLGGLAGWTPMILFLLYINHLVQTSQRQGSLIEELRQAQQELEQARRRESELAVLRERERLARDLHDSLGMPWLLFPCSSKPSNACIESIRIGLRSRWMK